MAIPAPGRGAVWHRRAAAAEYGPGPRRRCGRRAGPSGATAAGAVAQLTAAQAKTVLAISMADVSGTLGVAAGGTGAVAAPAARVNLGVDGYTPRGDAAYTILSTDSVVGTNAALTAARTFTLPAANTFNPGQCLLVVDTFGGVTSTNTLTIARGSTDTINGATSIAVNVAYGGYYLTSDGTSKWNAQPLGMSTLTTASVMAALPFGAF